MRFCLELILGTALLGNLCVYRVDSASLPAADTTPAAGAVRVVKVDKHTGKLVWTLVATPDARLDAAPDVHNLVAQAAKNFDVNPLLVDSVIQVESNYNPIAVSPKGAQGLMQLMPGTAQRFGVTDSFDPKQNIEAGVRYLKFLEDTFQDDRLAIAAYNAGEKAVAKYKDVPPYPETVSYVAKVGKKYGQAKQAAAPEAKKAEQPKPAENSGLVENSGDAPRHLREYLDPEGKTHLVTQ